MVTILMFFILFACVAMLYNEGMWSNAIRLINVITAALLAMNFFEPLADWLEQSVSESYTFFWDFISLWGLFIIFSIIFRQLTDRLSNVKVKFLKIADQVGSGVLSLWIGWVIVCFLMASLHTAPLSRNCLFDSFIPEEKMVLGFAPDRQWLGFTQKVSQGPYDRSDGEKSMFDPRGEFLLTYATRRANLESNVKSNGTLTFSGK
jgi:uncharacterized membrane protein required for colicin V production